MKAPIRLLILTTLLLGLFGTADATQAFGEPIRISFARGTTSTTVRGYVGARQVVRYVLGAGRGQPMSVSLFTPLNNVPPTGVYLAIFDAYGRYLSAAGAYQTNWSGVLPATQDYQIQVISVGGAAEYRLEISIPSQIRFAPGGISATLTGNVALERTNQYFFYARGNQTIRLTIYSPGDNVRLTLVGDDGNPLLRAAAMPGNTFTGILPATQRYHLIISQLMGISGTSYTLYISIV